MSRLRFTMTVVAIALALAGLIVTAGILWMSCRDEYRGGDTPSTVPSASRTVNESPWSRQDMEIIFGLTCCGG